MRIALGTPFTFNVKVHNAAYRALGVDYTFVCFGVEDVPGAIQAMRTLGIRGLNVTMPHKQAVIPHLDALDDTARDIGAVNTIDNRRRPSHRLQHRLHRRRARARRGDHAAGPAHRAARRRRRGTRHRLRRAQCRARR